MDAGTLFIQQSRRQLTDGYLPRIRRAVDEIGPDGLWWRPNEASNSVGNLLVHLAGNLGQWIGHGVAGEPDTRHRRAEFDATEGEDPMGELEAAVARVDGILGALDPARLSEPVTVQGRDVTVLDAVYHAVEHFVMHAGQIFYAAKLRTGKGLGFYGGTEDRPVRGW